MTHSAERLIKTARRFDLPGEIEPDSLIVQECDRITAELSATANGLLTTFTHYGDRLKTEDVYHRQMDLALKISKALAGKKLRYFKV